LAIAGALLTITWLHATKNKLIDQNLTQSDNNNIQRLAKAGISAAA
jgi:hypothetical protein